MQIDFTYDSSVSSAPAGFTAALAYAAGVLDTLITNPITVTIQVGWNEIGGVALGAGDVAEGGPLGGTGMSYAAVVAALRANVTDPAALPMLANLPAAAPSQISSYYIAPAQEKAWGMVPANSTEADGKIGFGSGYNYSFNPNDQTASGLLEFIGIAEHEITHVLGRINGDGPLELVDYSSAGVYATPNTGGYFSVDGGRTSLGQFNGIPNGDSADWASSSSGDSFDYLTKPGVAGILTASDRALLGALGYGINPAPTPSQFLIANQSSGQAGVDDGTPYSGPVAGLTQQLMLGGPNNMNVTSFAANSFIHTGAGNDAIDVSGVGGTNVLDGSTGSNFLTGGSGADTFYVDDRNAASAIWSTIAGFHSGDNATIWGVTQAGFTIDWLDGQGANGATGLTASFTAPGAPAVDMTLAGFTTADLSNGRLAVSFGTSPDEPGLAGSPYMNIRAT
jgi:hypothetical protein